MADPPHADEGCPVRRPQFIIVVIVVRSSRWKALTDMGAGTAVQHASLDEEIARRVNELASVSDVALACSHRVVRQLAVVDAVARVLLRLIEHFKPRA